MIYQDIQRNDIQAYIKYKAHYDKKANASKLWDADYVYFLQQKPGHRGSKFLFTDFRWIGPYIFEKVLPINIYLVRKIGTNKTQVLHRMPTRQFTSRQPPRDVRITPQERKHDEEVSLKHDDLYARAWECEYEMPIFDAENDNTTPPNSPEIPVWSDLSTEERWNTPETTRELSRAIFPQTEELWDVTDTCPYMEPDVDTSSEQPKKSPTNTRSSKYILRHNPKPNFNND